MGSVLMVQGTSSDAGKTVLCAALCRYLSDLGYRVAPFKAQNMALNAMAVPGGGEIGWAQVMQAEAARTAPTVEMNPVLLKPVSDTVSQVILRGRVVGDMSAREYLDFKKSAFTAVLAALESLRQQFDVVVVEGAGSPAEVNLRQHDIVNMRLAEAAEAPVLLVSDIDRGGMFAYVAGTLALLTESERKRVRGVVVNRFRGDKERLQPGLDSLTALTKVPVIGVLPYLNGLSLPAEDSLGLGGSSKKPWELDVVVLRLPRIANFTDIHILSEEDGLRVRYVNEKSELGQPHIIILPGTKNTLSDLVWLKESGLADEVLAAYRKGAYVVGICGGYQMLGREVRDLAGLDGTGGAEMGLELLAVETEFLPEKTADRVTGQTLHHGETLEGYEIHMGRTSRLAGKAFAKLTGETGQTYEDGATDSSGRVLGTYLHGVFDSPDFRLAYLNRVREAFKLPQQTRSGVSARQKRERSYRILSQAVSEHLECDFVLELLRQQERGKS